MDAKEMLLKEKLDNLLTQASKAAAELQALNQGIRHLISTTSSCLPMTWANGLAGQFKKSGLAKLPSPS